MAIAAVSLLGQSCGSNTQGGETVDARAGSDSAAAIAQDAGSTPLASDADRQLLSDADRQLSPDAQRGTGDALTGVACGVPAIVASGLDSPAALVSNGTHVYWVERTRVARVALAGGAVEEVATGLSQGANVALTSGSVYWADFGSREVRRAPLGGGVAVTIATDQGLVPTMVVDPQALYWIDQPEQGNSRVWSINESQDTATLLRAEAAYYEGIVAEDASLYMFRDNQIIRLPLSGGEPEIVASVETGCKFELRRQDGDFYWADACGGKIDKLSAGATTATVLVTGLTYPMDLALDGGFVYFVDDSQITSEDGIFARVPTSGGQPEILARSQHGPGHVLVVGDDVYWLNLGFWDNALDGSLMRMRKSCP
jgi:hypothetical protein